MSELPLRDRVAGSLYGLLVGDALGCPVEGWDRARIVATWGELETLESTPGDRWRPRGLHSDDGQQAIALCDALALAPDAPAEPFAHTLVALYRQGPRGKGRFGSHRGTGANFRAVVRALDHGGEAWSGAQPSAGNGVAMMIAPAAWWFRDDDAALARTIYAVGRVKTTDARALAAGAAVAWVVAEGLGAPESTVDTVGMLTFVRAMEARVGQALGAQPHGDAFSAALEAMLDTRNEPREVVLAGVAARATATADRPCGPSAGYAVASVITAIYLAITARSLDQALVDAVNLGDDADTVAAMVGAMVGARAGIRAIPQPWLNGLLARGHFDDRVDATVARHPGWRPMHALTTLEHAWSLIERV